jgi:preprotein translocase subunit Sec61beta
MAKNKSEGSGLQSSAGLMRYFEADDTAIKLDPKLVLGACIAAGVVILGLDIVFGLLRVTTTT